MVREKCLMRSEAVCCLDALSSTTRMLWKSTAEAGAVSAQAEADGFKAGAGGLRALGYRKRGLSGKPLITIATVVFNGVDHLEDTIKSVLGLPYDNVEFIVIDGGSTDGTVSLLQKYDGYIDYWVSEKDKGIYDAMNKAWIKASEDASILFLGAGDCIRSLPRSFDTNNIFYGNVHIGDRLFRSSLKYRLRFGNTLHHQALLIPKRLHVEAPFDVQFKAYADFDFNQRLLRRGASFAYAEEFVGYALPGGVSSTLDLPELLAVIKKNFGIIPAMVVAAYLKFKEKVIGSLVRVLRLKSF